MRNGLRVLLPASSAWIVLLALACGREASRSSGSGALAAAKQQASRVRAAPNSNVLVSPTSCEPTGECVFHDKAIGHSIDYEPGWVVDAFWLLFGATGDSIELYATVGDGPHGVAIATAIGIGPDFQERDSNGNTASYNRFRFGADGVVTLFVYVDQNLGDTVEYTLRMRRIKPEPTRLRTTGLHATLTISPKQLRDRFSVVPASVASSVRDLSKWTVFPRRYKVALVTDSLYEICRIPCVRPDSVTLTPSADVTRRYR